jgi:hypothetical protein
VTRQSVFLIFATLMSSVGSWVPDPPSPKHVEIGPSSVKTMAFDVQCDSGKVGVERRVLDVRIETDKHGTVTENVLIFYDPRTKLFWWENSLPLQHQLLPKNAVMCLTSSRLVMFWNGWVSTGQILVLESSDHATSLDEGQDRVLQLLEGRRADIEAGKFIRQQKRVEFPSLDRDFLFKKGVANLVGPTLREVQRVGNEWHIIEDGPNGGSALIVFDNQYNLLKTTILPSE